MPLFAAPRYSGAGDTDGWPSGAGAPRMSATKPHSQNRLKEPWRLKAST